MALKPTRRAFLGSTAAAATTAWTAGKGGRGGSTMKYGPNDRVNIGLIGCGGQGRADLGNHLKVPGVKAIAVCDLNQKRLQMGVEAAQNSSVKAYRDYRRLLEDKDIDAVIIATNGHWHVLPTIHACQAGKHVYVEKPLGTSIGEGRAAVEAAKKYGRIVQIGTQQRAGNHYQQAAEIVRSGRLGEVSQVHVWDYDNFYPGFGAPADSPPPGEFGDEYWDFWLGPSPQANYNENRFIHHYWFHDYGGGWQLDWAVHHYDIVNWYLEPGPPIAALGMGGFFCFEETNTEWPDTFIGICEFGPGPVARKGFVMQYTFRGGGVHTPTYNESHGKIFYGTEASLVIDRSGFTVMDEPPEEKRMEPWSLPQLTKVVQRVDADDRQGEKHAANFIGAIREGIELFAPVEGGHWASNPGHLMNISWRVGRKIRWDGVREQVIDDPMADELVTKRYRSPWKLVI